MASRSLDDLAPRVKAAAVAFVDECRACGLDVLIYCTLRSNEEQALIYKIGRSKPGAILTNALPGASLHNPDKTGKAWAFDAVPLVHGKAAFDDVVLLGLMGVCGESVGLTWAGRWRGNLRELVHFELRGFDV